MINKIKLKIFNALDAKSDDLPLGFFAGITVISSIIAKGMSSSFILVFLICMALLMLLSTVIQIVRKKRNVYFYLGGTAFCIFLSIIMWFMQYYTKLGNDTMFINVVRVFLNVLAIIMNLMGIFYIKNKRNPKDRKIIIVICMIVITIIALSAIVFLPPKGM